MKKLLLILLMPALATAQEGLERKSIHQLESELHRNDPVSSLVQAPFDVPMLRKSGGSPALVKKVYGWHPYWASKSAYATYDYGALTHIAFFSYETDTATGSYLNVHEWQTTPIVEYAHQQGVKVTLTVTNFGYTNNDKLLSDTAKQQRMINTLIALLQMRNGDGVNFDLESVNGSQRENLVSFMRRASTQIKAQLPNAEISMATPAVDWRNGWDFAQLAQICDYLIVMGYDYYYSSSPTAGPVAPLAGESYNVTLSVETYLNAGVPSSKLLLGVPWFGFDWPVQSSARKAARTGTASSRTYAIAEQMASLYGKTFDALTKVPWFSYQIGTDWRQVWYDDTASLSAKYALVNSRALGGIGIWALSYDGARREIWNGIKAAFGTTGIEDPGDARPGQFALYQNYPNPLNPRTAISYQLPALSEPRSLGRVEGSASSFVTLKVFDLLGREVAVLVDQEMPSGYHTVTWNAQNLPSGVYMYRLIAGNHVESKKMQLLK